MKTKTIQWIVFTTRLAKSSHPHQYGCFYDIIAKDKYNNRAVVCNGVIIHQMLPDTKAYITSVYTEEKYIRNVIQNILMKMVLDFLNEINCKKIELDSSNQPAIKLYEKFGFIKNDIKYILINL